MSIFKFKQFSVDQSNCAMKINTDGVLLGALAEADNPNTVLDIGTGTGVIALMLAQRFAGANIDVVEIDEGAAETARTNLNESPFNKRMQVHAVSFETFFEEHVGRKFELIVSNPPFFLNSLESPGAKKNLARHADEGFYLKLIRYVAGFLTDTGTCQLILPLETAALLKQLLVKYNLQLHKQIDILSFAADKPHREILIFGKQHLETANETFVIYDEPKVYSQGYQRVLKDFLTIL